MNPPHGVIGFLGLPGTGKTFQMKRLFWDCLRVVVFNFASGFGPKGRCKPNQNPLPGFTFVYSVPDLLMVLQKAGSGRVRVCFTPINVPPDKSEKDVFNDVCKYVLHFSEKLGGTVFAIDEIWNAQTPSWSPQWLNKAMLQWRHYDVCLMWTAQRPAEVDATLRGMSTEVYCGRVMQEMDVKAVRKCAFPDEVFDILPTLPDRQFVHRFETGEWRLEK